jgi:hypothetical protein
MNQACSLVTGFGLGAGVMYFFDPQQGRRRRKLLLDQVNSAMCDVRCAADATMRDLRNRSYGTFAEARSAFAPHDNSDRVLTARVRSKLGRYVSHPAAIKVEAHDGCVCLSGPILASEVQPLVARVKSITGVRGVENCLDVHETAGNIAALQGGKQPLGEIPELFQSNWSPTTRLLMGSLGGAMALLYGGSRAPTSLLLQGVGMGLAACSLMPTTSQPGTASQPGTTPQQRTRNPSAAHDGQPRTHGGESQPSPASTSTRYGERLGF